MSINIPDLREYEILSNADFFDTKKKLSEKVMVLLGECAHQLKKNNALFESVIPAEVLEQTAKISRGENFRNTPWFILDYPRYFKGKDIFTIRTLCWFGHSFSITLHLSGKYATKYRDRLLENLPKANDGNFYICINDVQWEHHFEEENYQAIEEFLTSGNRLKSTLDKKDFIKISKKVGFESWSVLPEICQQTASLFFEMIRL